MEERLPKDEMGLMQLLSLVLSILVLAGMGVQMVIPFRPAADQLFDEIDFCVCMFFLADFFYRWYHAESKLGFLKWGWIDFVSSLPTVGILQIGRIARVFRILRILRVFRSSQALWKYVSHNRPKATLKGAVLVALVTFILSSIVILEVESTPSANITTPSDSVWWSFTTMITVGCDKSPVTQAGRVVGAVLSIVGVGLMGVYTAYVASFFIGGSSNAQAESELVLEIRALRLQLAAERIQGYQPNPQPQAGSDDSQLEKKADAASGHSTISTGHLGSTAMKALP